MNKRELRYLPRAPKLRWESRKEQDSYVKKKRGKGKKKRGKRCQRQTRVKRWGSLKGITESLCKGKKGGKQEMVNGGF